MKPRGYALVEGHGEVGAVDNLVARLWREAGRHETWARAARWKNLHLPAGVEQGVALVRAKGDAGALLLMRDEDDACPALRGPELAALVRRLAPPFPVAIVLMRREYEVLFLPCVEAMAGRPIVGTDGQSRPGLLAGTRYDGDWEAKRDVKGWLTAHFPPGRAYKPTLDQLPLTRMIDLPTLRAAGVPSFGTLERALGFLATRFGGSGVYPAEREGEASVGST